MVQGFYLHHFFIPLACTTFCNTLSKLSNSLVATLYDGLYELYELCDTQAIHKHQKGECK